MQGKSGRARVELAHVCAANVAAWVNRVHSFGSALVVVENEPQIVADSASVQRAFPPILQRFAASSGYSVAHTGAESGEIAVAHAIFDVVNVEHLFF